MSTPVVHLAGLPIEHTNSDGTVLRQRCAWCGAMLIDTSLTDVEWVAIDDDGEVDDEFPRFTSGTLVEVDNPDGDAGTYTALESPDVPESACLKMPREVTR